MSHLYNCKRMDSISVSEILQIGARAAAMRRAGRDVIILGAGEPDFDTPDHVKAAADKAIRDGKTKYTALEGTLELRTAISNKLRRENDIEYTPSETIVSTGAKQVIFNALMATIEAGDEVIIPAPYWTSYLDMAAIVGGVGKIVPCGPDTGFKLTPAALEQAINHRTRWVFFNSPANPSGAAYARDELAGLLEVLRKHPRVLIISDEIYEHIVYDGFTHTSPAQLAPYLRDRILIVNGVSKAYAMTGWRIGWGAGPKGLIDAMAAVQSQITSCASSVGQAAAVEALNGPQDDIALRARSFCARRDFLVSEFNAMPGMSVIRPAGAFYLFPSIQSLIGRMTPAGRALMTDSEVCQYFLEEALVAVVPGSAFALPGFMRLSYAASQESLAEACKRIRTAASKLVEPNAFEKRGSA